jgi:uncharacterized protein YkwD
MNRISILFCVVICILCLSSECGNNDDSPEEILKREMLSEINQIRLTGCLCGQDSMPSVPELQWDEALTSAAKRHVLDMSTNNFLSHSGSDGSTPANRAIDAGYAGVYIGENIARGFSTTHDVMNRWKSSESNCKTIMDKNYFFIGAATNYYYWTQVFGSN